MRRNSITACGCICAFLALAVWFPATARAEGYAITEWSARGTALAGGMVARADDPSAVAYNPAGITQLPGTRLMLGSVLLAPIGTIRTEQDGIATDTDARRKLWPVPHLYATHQLSERAWVGLGIFSRFGLGNEYPASWPGNTGIINVELVTGSVTPTVAFKLTDALSWSVGGEILYATMRLKQGMNLPPLGSYRSSMDADGIATGFNTALHYRITDQWSAGITYRSRMSANLSGSMEWSPDAAFLAGSDTKGTLSMPDVFSAGVAYKPTERLSFEVTGAYTAWSVYKNMDITMTDTGTTVHTPKNWRDTWTMGASVEYKAYDWLTLRAGYLYETSPLREGTYDYLIPSNGRQNFSTGVGVAWNSWTLDLGYSYQLIHSINYSARGTAPNYETLPGKSRNASMHIGAISLAYAF